MRCRDCGGGGGNFAPHVDTYGEIYARFVVDTRFATRYPQPSQRRQPVHHSRRCRRLAACGYLRLYLPRVSIIVHQPPHYRSGSFVTFARTAPHHQHLRSCRTRSHLCANALFMRARAQLHVMRARSHAFMMMMADSRATLMDFVHCALCAHF